MKSDAIEIALSPSNADTISSKDLGRKQDKYGRMRSFFTRPKSPKKASKAFDDDDDMSLVTTLSGMSHSSARYGKNKPRAVGRSISPCKSSESGVSRARARGKSPVRFRDDVSLSSFGDGSIIIKKKGSGYTKCSKRSGKNAVKSQDSNLSQNRDEIQTCTSIDSTTTTKEEHFELGVTITCVSELRENEIKEESIDPVIYMTSDSEVSVIKNDAEVTQTLSKFWACVDINQLFGSAFAKSDLDEMKKNIKKSSDHVVAVEESFGNIASNVVALAEKKREEELSSAEKIQLHSDVVSTLNVINKNVGELLARKASSEADKNVSDKVDRNLETNEKEVDVQAPVKPDEVSVQVGDGAIASEVPAEKTLDECVQVDSEVAVHANSINENSELSASQAIVQKDSINLVACLDYYQSVDLVSDLFAGLQEAVNNKKNEGKPETGCVQESKNIESGEVEGEVTEPVAEDTKPPVVEESLIVEEKNQEVLSANELLMVDGNKQEEELIVAEEPPIVEENKQDELQPTQKSHNINEDVEQNTLFELVYSLHTYFDHTELDEVIKNLSTCGASTYESEKTVPKNYSVTGDMSTSDAATTSDSDEAVVLEDLNNSPRVLVYEENRINFIDECFDTLDGVEYCTAVVNTACNPCTSSINVQDLMRDEIRDKKETVNDFNVQDLMVDGIQDRKETVKNLTGE